MIKELIKKYGDDFNWWIPNKMEYLNKEIQKEYIDGYK